MDRQPVVKTKDGIAVEVIPVKNLKFQRGFSHLLENLPLYANQFGEWYVEKEDVEQYLKE